MSILLLYKGKKNKADRLHDLRLEDILLALLRF